MPDLLVRGDVLERLFPGVYALELERQSDEEGCAPDAPARLVAPRLGGPHHYRVVDIKFTELHLAASGGLGNGGSGPAYKAQLFLYNRALGSAQGLIPPAAFLLGRSWEKGEDGGRGFAAEYWQSRAEIDAVDTLVRALDAERERSGLTKLVSAVDCLLELVPNTGRRKGAHAATAGRAG